MNEKFDMVAKTFQGLEGVLADELRALGASDVTEGRRMVSFSGDKEMLYRANFCTHTALRVLKPFLRFNSSSADDLYEQLLHFDWVSVMSVNQTFAIDSTTNGEEFRHSRFVTYRVKDAIADHFMAAMNKRPSIRVSNPEIRFDVHIVDHDVIVSLDSSGEPLYRRGWRVQQTEAPINEVLAAGILRLSGWDGQTDLVDPMCGSGTFLIEAALIATNINPGVFRKSFAFQNWPDYDADLFDAIYNDDSGEREFAHKIYGYDIEGQAIAIARANVKSAGVAKYVELERRPLDEWTEAPAGGTLVTNPPYGARLKAPDLEQTYALLGNKLKNVFQGYNAWIICYDKELNDHIGLRPSLRYPLNNGGLDCELRQYVIFEGRYNEMRSRGEHIRNEEFRASENSRPMRRFDRDDDRPPRRFDRDDRPPRRFDRDDDRPPRRFDRDDRPPRRFDLDDDRPPRRFDRDDDRPPRRFERDDDRPPRRFDRDDRPPRRFERDDDIDRHSEEFARRILRDRKPRLSADQEVPIVHGRRKSWKRRDLDDNPNGENTNNEA